MVKVQSIPNSAKNIQLGVGMDGIAVSTMHWPNQGQGSETETSADGMKRTTASLKINGEKPLKMVSLWIFVRPEKTLPNFKFKTVSFANEIGDTYNLI